MKTDVIAIRLTPEEKKKLKAKAQREGMTMSSLIRVTLLDSLKYQF